MSSVFIVVTSISFVVDITLSVISMFFPAVYELPPEPPCISIFPEPSIEFPFIVFMFSPEINVSCFPLTSSFVAY